jgi:hypothetical protein
MVLGLLRASPWLAGLVAWGVAYWSSDGGLADRPVTAILAWVLALATMAGVTWAQMPAKLPMVRRHLYLAPIVLLASAGWFLLFVPSSSARLWCAVGVGALVARHFLRLRAAKSDGKLDATVIESLALSWIISVFFVAAGLFGIAGFAELPTPALAAGFGLAAGLITFGASRPFPLATPDRRVAALAFGAFGAQLYAAVSFFPTGALVGSAVLATFYAVGLFVLHRVSHAPTAPHHFRREFMLAFVLATVVLATGQWN